MNKFPEPWDTVDAEKKASKDENQDELYRLLERLHKPKFIHIGIGSTKSWPTKKPKARKIK